MEGRGGEGEQEIEDILRQEKVHKREEEGRDQQRNGGEEVKKDGMWRDGIPTTA